MKRKALVFKGQDEGIDALLLELENVTEKCNEKLAFFKKRAADILTEGENERQAVWNKLKERCRETGKVPSWLSDKDLVLEWDKDSECIWGQSQSEFKGGDNLPEGLKHLLKHLLT